MRRTPLLTFVSALLAACVSMTSTSAAQTATGQITGTVRDATGAVMAGVKVVASNQQTGLARRTTTGANGEYVIPLLPVGLYVVTGEQTGERTVNRWFNTAAFAQPAPGALGNLGRNTERGPGVNNLDLALFKNVPRRRQRSVA